MRRVGLFQCKSWKRWNFRDASKLENGAYYITMLDSHDTGIKYAQFRYTAVVYRRCGMVHYVRTIKNIFNGANISFSSAIDNRRKDNLVFSTTYTFFAKKTKPHTVSAILGLLTRSLKFWWTFLFLKTAYKRGLRWRMIIVQRSVLGCFPLTPVLKFKNLFLLLTTL